jgi:putative ABC transport system ATP-binding protein
MSEYVVEAKDVTKVYEAGEIKVTALSDVNLQVERGEFISIMGPSGSGKTTLLSILGCLDKPTSGQVIIDGLDVVTMREAELPKIRAEKIGFVFQTFNLIPTLSALENVELPMERGKIPKSERRSRALELLKSVGLEDKADRRPNRLSSGEQQRVAIARALANGPAIILADEPTGNLDSKTGREIVQLLRKLSREEERTIILVTHDSQMASLSNRMLFLKDGKLLKKAKWKFD